MASTLFRGSWLQFPKTRSVTAWPVALAGVLGVAYLILAPPSADLAAQLLRTRLFQAAPLGLWNNWWFGGQYSLGYSVLFPPLAVALGPRVVGVLAAVAATGAFSSLSENRFASCWFALGTVCQLASGRLTLMLGVALAAGAVLACVRGRPLICGLLTVLTALASPVAALLLVVSAVALRRVTLAVCLVPLLGLALTFGSGGFEPFAFSAFWPVWSVSVALAVLARGALRVGLAVYAAGCLSAVLIHTPVGGNAAQLGQLLLGPVAVLVIDRRGRVAILCALALLYLQCQPAVRDVVSAARDPSTSAAYYRPLITFLDRQRGPVFRLEVPLTANHWETYELALRFPLARGWERQTDIADDPLFYGRAPLNMRTYLAWLHGLAVRFIAVPAVPLDASGTAEARLAERLPEVARLANWRVYAVPDPTPIVSGARLVRFGADGLSIDIARPGSAVVRVRYSPLWRLSGVRGVVTRDGAFIRIRARGRGEGSLRLAL